MTSVDSRVVELGFNNTDFESKVAATMASLDKLKLALDFANAKKSIEDLGATGANLDKLRTSLNFDKSKESLDNLSGATKRFSLANMTNAIENVSHKFLALSAVGLTVISNLTNRAVNAGFSIGKAFSFAPVIAGFQEMETNMNSIQTILANTDSKGTTLTQVNAALAQLNTYSDQTIYNFAQMARNIGTFTAAGVDLDTSVNSIKGIANLAAISGSNAEQASTAMYQLSQALASGTVKLMDWNSIVNAGMGGEVFQKALFETGKSLKTIKGVGLETTFDEWKDAGNSFRGSLEEGWLTAEVLTNTLQGFTGDLDAAQLKALGYTDEQAVEMLRLGALGKAAATEVKTLTQLLGTIKESIGSGWSRTFQLIFGDFNEAKALFTSLNNVIGKFVGDNADARNDILQTWHDFGARTALLEGLSRVFEKLGLIMKPIGEAFRTIFPPMTGERLIILTDQFRNFTKTLGPSGKTIRQIREIFLGFFSALKFGFSIIVDIQKVIWYLFDTFKNVDGGNLLSFFADIGTKVTAFNEKVQAAGGVLAILADKFNLGFRAGFRVKQIFEGIIAIFQIAWSVVEDLGSVVSFLFRSMSDRSEEAGAGIYKVLVNLAHMGETIIEFKDKILEAGGVFAFLADKFDIGFRAIFRIKQIFEGVLAIFSIGWTIIKELAGAVLELFQSFDAGVEGPGVLKILQFMGRFAQGIIDLKEQLVDGGGIAEFFDKLVQVIKHPGEMLDFLKDKFNTFFEGVDFGSIDGLLEAFSRIKDAITDFIGVNIPDSIKDFFGKVMLKFQNSSAGDAIENLGNRFNTFTEILSKVWGVVQKAGNIFGWFFDKLITIGSFAIEAVKGLGAILGGIGDAILDGFDSPGMKNVISLAKIALAGILVGIFAGFKKDGLKIDLTGGALSAFGDSIKDFKKVIPGITGSLDQLTGLLKTMQTSIKSDIIMKIAIAIGVLTLSILILSTIDGDKLAAAMTAMVAGFTQLIGAMALLNTLSSGPKSSANLALIAGGLILLAGAMVIMALAMKIFATMSWEDIGKGFTGLAGGLVAISIAMDMMPKGSEMLKTSASLIAVGIALNLIAASMKIFASMSWEEIGKGFVGVYGGLAAIAIAMEMMPQESKMLSSSIALIAIGVALNLIGASMKIFASMSWGEIGKGLVGVYVGLTGIAIAMDLMPSGPSMLLQSVALIAVGIALNIIATAVKSFASMGWGELAKGLLAMSVSLNILAGAAQKMVTALPGAIAIGILAISMSLLTKVLEKLATIPLLDLAKGIGAIAVIIRVLAAVATTVQPAIIPLIALAGALFLIGAALALFGVGTKAIASAFKTMAETGREGVSNFVFFAEQIIVLIPKMVASVAKGIIELAMILLDAAPLLIQALGILIMQILDTLITLAPKFGEALKVLIITGLKVVRDLIPDVVATGFAILTGLLKGIRDNIGEIVTTVADIITNFLDALSLKVPSIIDSAYNLIIAVIEGVVAKLGTVASFLLPKGLELIGGLLAGLGQKLPDILSFFTDLPGQILGWIGDVASFLKEKGLHFVGGLLLGIIEKGLEVVIWWQTLPIKILGWIGAVAGTLKQKGIDFIVGLINGTIEKVAELITFYKALPGNIVDFLGDVTKRLLQKGKDLIEGLWDGVKAIYENVKDWFKDLPSKIVDWFGDALGILKEVGKDIVQGLWNGILAMKDYLIRKLKEFAGWIPGPIRNLLGLDSPSRLFREFGVNIVQGLIIGIDDMRHPIQLAAEDLSNVVTDGFNPTTDALQTTLNELFKSLDGMSEFNPTITPVLDLTNVKMGAKTLSSMLGSSPLLTPTISSNQASAISFGTRTSQAELSTPDRSMGPTEIKFEQHNHSPEALSTADIYRQTRNQITMAKEELSVL